MFDAFNDFTPAQQQQFRDQILGETYQHFVNLVARRRGLSVARVDQIAQGRVWTGDDAIKLKLVDGIGGLDEAIKAARELAKVPEDTKLGLLELPTPPGLLIEPDEGQDGRRGLRSESAFRRSCARCSGCSTRPPVRTADGSERCSVR